MKFTKLPILTFALFSLVFASSSYAKTLRCERYQEMGTEFFTNYAAYESWFPKTLSLEPEDFEKIPGRKSIQKSRTQYEVNNPSSIKRRYVLFPTGKLTISSPTVSNASGRYKCNMTPTEVLEVANAKKVKTPKTQTQTARTQAQTKRKKCYSGELASCDEKMLCNRGTSYQWVNGKTIRSWEKDVHWRPFVAEAIKRGLDCGVTDIEDNEIPASVKTPSGNGENKVAKAEEKCTSLGFTAGTEKHGDCVMKLLDY